MFDTDWLLSHLAADSDRFLDAVSAAPLSVKVPSCPEWDAADLLWHLGEVQYFWATIVRERLDDPHLVEETKPRRPDDLAELMSFFSQASHDLRGVLAAAPPETHVWTWAPDQTVGFVRRRQAHEALIHRVDAELLSGQRSPVDIGLAADGIDEALRVMYAMAPPWGRVEPDPGATVRIRAMDNQDCWLVMLGRFRGTDPASGTAHDLPALTVADVDSGAPSAAELRGSAADLDCWLWRRPTLDTLDRRGDPGVLARFEEMIGGGIQ